MPSYLHIAIAIGSSDFWVIADKMTTYTNFTKFTKIESPNA
ncbi:hypothetical protein [Pseudanabaena sp. UWO310]|nr:hypothetical protein [Pseudanabaena sp. UWO310]